jgi:hypothetical protein
MRLGREQASGYVEDTAEDPITAEEPTIHAAERAVTAPAAEPVVPIG